MIPIKYIGHRAFYRDGACGSELSFEQGQTLLVEDQFALKMLRHPSVYERGDAIDSANEVPAIAQAKKDAPEQDDDPNQTMRDTIAQMNKEALASYAKSNFNVDLDKRVKVDDLRQQVTTLFDQFGTE